MQSMKKVKEIKKMKKVILYGVAVMGCCMSVSGYAFGIVHDPINYLQLVATYHKLMAQYEVLQDSYHNAQQQLGQEKQQVASITGHYGWGNWQNSSSELTQQREWAPGDWQSALKGMSGGNPARYQQLLTQYRQNHPTLSTDQFAKGTDAPLSQSYQHQVQTNQASATSATYEFNDINRHLKTLYQLGQQIEDKNSTLKSAVDLNSRIQLEVAYIAIEEVRMQTLLNQQMAAAQSGHIAQENEAAQYNQAGETPQ